VILVNGHTASASEILTAAVKDKGQGKIVGKKTYGKGVVQTSGEFSDGSGYKLTIMQYFSPDGKTINKKGVKPDYVVKGSKAQLNKAIELLK
jgi:carboxyl-terminal processing protease